jgi:hypothetical protein
MDTGNGALSDPCFSGSGRSGDQTVGSLYRRQGINLEGVRAEFPAWRYSNARKNFFSAWHPPRASVEYVGLFCGQAGLTWQNAVCDGALV